ncbi:porin, partial [Rhodopseudomonas palustris]
MNIIKQLALGTAAAVIAVGSAQAADLPLKAKAVEYVKVCSIYGAGFYYIPGTDTCIKLGGYLRADVTMFGSGGYNAPAWNGNAGQKNRLSNDYIFRSRQDINIDTRTATEYGVVRTYFDATFNWTTGSDTIANGSLGVYYAFIQFAGFTFGKAVSQFDTPWTG